VLLIAACGELAQLPVGGPDQACNPSPMGNDDVTKPGFAVKLTLSTELTGQSPWWRAFK